ncbi:hypothetical protein IFR05_000491 [Cadophora sp. M221]|nr:hypothetical protein IFR05_000491 [Cadophora sp. M221]
MFFKSLRSRSKSSSKSTKPSTITRMLSSSSSNHPPACSKIPEVVISPPLSPGAAPPEIYHTRDREGSVTKEDEDGMEDASKDYKEFLEKAKKEAEKEAKEEAKKAKKAREVNMRLGPSGWAEMNGLVIQADSLVSDTRRYSDCAHLDMWMGEYFDRGQWHLTCKSHNEPFASTRAGDDATTNLQRHGMRRLVPDLWGKDRTLLRGLHRSRGGGAELTSSGSGTSDAYFQCKKLHQTQPGTR